jgi:hypothetical protein
MHPARLRGLFIFLFGVVFIQLPQVFPFAPATSARDHLVRAIALALSAFVGLSCVVIGLVRLIRKPPT